MTDDANHPHSLATLLGHFYGDKDELEQQQLWHSQGLTANDLVFEDPDTGELLKGDGTPAGLGFVGVKAAFSGTHPVPSGSYEPIPFTGVDALDSHGFHDPGGANPSRLVVPDGLDGPYEANVAVRVASNIADATRLITRFAVNGVLGEYIYQTAVGKAVPIVWPGSEILDLVAGDFVEVNVYQDSGAPIDAAGGFFSLHRIS